MRNNFFKFLVAAWVALDIFWKVGFADLFVRHSPVATGNKALLCGRIDRLGLLLFQPSQVF